MKQAQDILTVLTAGEGFFDITHAVIAWVKRAGHPLLTLFGQHTSAGLLIQKNADPDVLKDLRMCPRRRVSIAIPPKDRTIYRPIHIKSMLTGVHLSLPRLSRSGRGVYSLAPAGDLL